MSKLTPGKWYINNSGFICDKHNIGFGRFSKILFLEETEPHILKFLFENQIIFIKGVENSESWFSELNTGKMV